MVATNMKRAGKVRDPAAREMVTWPLLAVVVFQAFRVHAQVAQGLCGVSAIVLTGTTDGAGAAATVQAFAGSLTTTSTDALVIAGFFDASGNTSISGANAPFTELSRGGAGSASHASAYL